ncbi:LamG domain-containing protein [bacterium]|nr:LamG domain-containing protein [bacterium]
MRIVLTIIAFSAMICASAYAGLDIVDGMVSAWLFTDGLAVDSVGSNHGVIRGGAGPGEVKGGATGAEVKGGATGAEVKGGATGAEVKGGATGAEVKGGGTGTDVKGGGAFYGGTVLSFDGVDDYVEIPDHPSLHLPEGMTIAAWINVNVGVNHAAVAWKGEMIGWGANFSWRVATTSDTDLTWGRCTEGAENYFATAGVIPATGEWIHVAMTCMAPGAPTNQRAYVNGEDITDVTDQTDQIAAEPPFLVFEGSPIEIGVGRGVSGEAGNDAYFDGMIDDVVIYNRGLTAAEIVELMNTDLAYLLQDTAVDAVGKIPAVWGKIKQQ